MRARAAAGREPSAFETDLLNGLYRRLFAAWGLSELEASLGFGANLADAQARAMRALAPDATRLVALLLPSSHADAHEFDGQMAGFLEELEQHLAVEIVCADPADVDELAADPRTLLYQLGTADMAVSAVADRLKPLLSIRGASARWYTSPFTSQYEKHLLPWLSGRYGDLLEVPESYALDVAQVGRVVAERAHSVMKHGRNLKRVLIGARTTPETWRDGALLAAHAGEYIVQRAVTQTPQRVPMWVDGAPLLVEVVEELSPFLIGDEIRACFVRFLPVGSASDVVSPPPKDLGLSVARVLPAD